MFQRLRLAKAATANPHDRLERQHIRCEILRLCRHPVTLRTPVVVIAGWRTPAIAIRPFTSCLRRLTGAPRDSFLEIALPWTGDMARVVRHATAVINARYPNTLVDVIGVSMGGLALVRRLCHGRIGTQAVLRLNVCSPSARPIAELGSPRVSR